MLNRYVVMESAKPHEMSQYIRQSVGRHNIKVRELGDSNSVIKHTGNKLMSFNVIKYGAEVEVSGPPQDNSYHIQIALGGNCIVDHSGKLINLHSGQGVIINPDKGSTILYQDNCEKLIITLDTSIVHRRLMDLIGFKVKEQLNFDPDINSDAKDNGYLLDLLFFYGNMLDKQKDNASVDSINNVMMASIVDLLIKFHSNNYSHLILSSENNFPVYLKKAVNYIHSNLTTVFTLKDLVDISKVGERVLYKSFQTYFKMTPLTYIKSVRLKKIRECLMAELERDVKVTDIAMNFGFSHLGRFSGEYKSMFGELPSETLKKKKIF